MPEHLSGHAFTTQRAQAAGLGEGRLRGKDLVRPLHGLRAPSDAADEQGQQAAARRLAAVASLALPDDCAFSHCTAAAILSLPVPQLREHCEPLHVMRGSGRNRVDRPQVRAHRGLERREVTLAQGVRVVSAADTWIDLASLLGVEDLIVLGDAIVRREGSCEPLRAALLRRGSTRGTGRLREALRWIRVGSDSPMETRSRLLFCRHGLPEPELNVEITAADGSGFICRSDLVWRRQRVIGEYQGAHHFGSFERGDDDIARRHLAQDDGWTYLDITKADHHSPSRRAAMLRRFAHHLGVERVADRPSPAWESRFPTPSATCGSG